MAFSITKEEIINRGYVHFNYNRRKIKGKNLVVAEHGGWAALEDRELEILESGVIEKGSELFSLLEEKGIILTLKNSDAIEDLYRQRMGFLYHGVSLHIVVLTRRCTHRCVYCHASAKGSKSREFDMSVETAKKTVDFIFQSPAHCITIEFQGGEPLLNFEALKFIVKYSKEKNASAKKDLRITVVTNLQIMDEEKLGFLMKEDVSICTSLDGPEGVHNLNRPAEDKSFNSHKNAVEWIKKIQERCKKEKKSWTASALVTITRNSMERINEIIDEYAALGIETIHVRPINMLGFSKENFNSIGYSAEEFIEMWKKAADSVSYTHLTLPTKRIV